MEGIYCYCGTVNGIRAKCRLCHRRIYISGSLAEGCLAIIGGRVIRPDPDDASDDAPDSPPETPRITTAEDLWREGHF